jgi:hypothetical protein
LEYVTRQPQPLKGLQLQTLEIMFVPLEKPATSRWRKLADGRRLIPLSQARLYVVPERIRRVEFGGSSRILVGKKPRCDVAMSHNFQWLFGVFKGLKTGHDFGHEKTA